MKLFMKKIFLILFAIAAGIFFTSCKSIDGTVYNPKTVSASFPSSIIQVNMLPADGNKFQVPLWRGNTSGTASVAVTIDDPSGAFTPSSKSFDFADGESVAYITFSYADLNNFTGAANNITITLDNDSDVSVSGISTTQVQAKRKLTMKLIGTGTYHSDWPEEDWAQPVYEAEEAHYYELPDCFYNDGYSAAKGYTICFSISKGKVIWPDEQNTGVYNSGRTSKMYLTVGNTKLTGRIVEATVDYHFPGAENTAKRWYEGGSAASPAYPERFTFPDSYTIPTD